MKKVSKRKGPVGPSAESLREIPELGRNAEVLGRGAAGLRRAKALLSTKRGRPKKGERAEGSSPRSVRLPDRVWKQLEEEAERRGESVHALLREAIAKWLEKAA